MKNYKPIIILFISFIFLLFVQKIYAQNNKELDSLKYLLKTSKTDTTKIILKIEIGSTLVILRKGYYDSLRIDCEKLLDKSSDKAVIKVIKKCLAMSFNKIGYISYLHGNITDAIEYYKKGMIIREDIGDKNGIANSLNNIGNIYESHGDVVNALQYFFKSLKICEVIGEKNGTVAILSNIGSIYYNQGDNGSRGKVGGKLF